MASVTAGSLEAAAAAVRPETAPYPYFSSGTLPQLLQHVEKVQAILKERGLTYLLVNADLPMDPSFPEPPEFCLHTNYPSPSILSSEPGSFNAEFEKVTELQRQDDRRLQAYEMELDRYWANHCAYVYYRVDQEKAMSIQQPATAMLAAWLSPTTSSKPQVTRDTVRSSNSLGSSARGAEEGTNTGRNAAVDAPAEPTGEHASASIQQWIRSSNTPPSPDDPESLDDARAMTSSDDSFSPSIRPNIGNLDELEQEAERKGRLLVLGLAKKITAALSAKSIVALSMEEDGELERSRPELKESEVMTDEYAESIQIGVALLETVMNNRFSEIEDAWDNIKIKFEAALANSRMATDGPREEYSKNPNGSSEEAATDETQKPTLGSQSEEHREILEEQLLAAESQIASLQAQLKEVIRAREAAISDRDTQWAQDETSLLNEISELRSELENTELLHKEHCSEMESRLRAALLDGSSLCKLMELERQGRQCADEVIDEQRRRIESLESTLASAGEEMEELRNQVEWIFWSNRSSNASKIVIVQF
ncbi:hypothetical protein DFJ73DRAFT_778117 [Zopfochytrium polystomum]|nr:hypothetical protein DFJ73DRAFT_778117 [Zopfochytrium polystomum]